MINGVASILRAGFDAGGKLLIIGNGGSAADASHIAAEFLGRFQKERRGLPAIALVDPAVLTAIGNDFGFEQVFARQVEALGKPGDVLMAISTSGRSPNVLRAIEAARAKGMSVVGLTGSEAMADLCDAAFISSAPTAAGVQQNYMAAAHLICEMVEA